MTYTLVQSGLDKTGTIDDPKRTYPSANQTIRNLLDTEPLHFYHYLRRIGYTHRSAVVSVLMYYSPNKEDLYRRLRRHRRYTEAQVVIPCACCGKDNVKVIPCPGCGELICQDCAPDFGAHVCELE